MASNSIDWMLLIDKMPELRAKIQGYIIDDLIENVLPHMTEIIWTTLKAAREVSELLASKIKEIPEEEWQKLKKSLNQQQIVLVEIIRNRGA